MNAQISQGGQPAAAEEPVLNVHVNLDALIGNLQHDLQSTINLVALSMRGDVGDDEEIQLPTGPGMHVNFASRLRWNVQERLEKRDNWLITNSLRDCIEHTGVFLEKAREILALWGLLDSRLDNRVAFADFQAVGTSQLAFRDKNFPDKVLAFANDFDIQIETALVEQVLSINRARNCYVHRRGVVTEKDLKGDAALRVRWRSLQPKFRGADGIEVPLQFGVVVGPGDVFVRVEDREKQFTLGTRLNFTLQEFIEICWGIFLFSRALVDGITTSGQARGYINPAPAAEAPAAS